MARKRELYTAGTQWQRQRALHTLAEQLVDATDEEIAMHADALDVSPATLRVLVADARRRTAR